MVRFLSGRSSLTTSDIKLASLIITGNTIPRHEAHMKDMNANSPMSACLNHPSQNYY